MQLKNMVAVEEDSALILNLRTGKEKGRLLKGGSVFPIVVICYALDFHCRLGFAFLWCMLGRRQVFVDLVSDLTW